MIAAQGTGCVAVALVLATLATLDGQSPGSRPGSKPATRPTATELPHGWVTDYQQACTSAKAEGKDLLLGFVGYDWCEWCRRLRQEVFDNESFQQRAPQVFVLVQVDSRRRQQGAALRKQNRDLRQKFGIQAYPTIYLADAAGRPYARTGYREVGPEIYLGHLLELQEIRKKRDDEFQKAADAKGPERGRYLAAGLDALARGIPLDDYLPIIDEILALDPDDKESLRTRFTEVKRRVAREAAMRRLTREVDALAAKKQWAEILVAVARFRKAQDPAGTMLQQLLWIEATVHYEQDQKPQARAKFEEVMKLDPNSDLGKQANKALRSLGN